MDEYAHSYHPPWIPTQQDCLGCLAQGDLYTISSTIVCPTQVAWPCRRARRWTVLVLKAMTIPLPLDRFMEHFMAEPAKPQITFRVFLVEELTPLDRQRIALAVSDTAEWNRHINVPCLVSMPKSERRSELTWARSRPSSMASGQAKKALIRHLLAMPLNHLPPACNVWSSHVD